MAGLSLKSKALGANVATVGAGAMGAGAALQVFGSADQAASQQLATSITNTGGSMSDYQSKIDKTVSSMTKYGDTSSSVQNSLSLLTTGLKSPTAALSAESAVANLAAEKHESLSEATTQYIQIAGGKGTRTLATLGLTIYTAATATAALTQLTSANTTAQGNASDAQAKLTALKVADAGKTTLSAQAQAQLKQAEDDVIQTQQRAKISTDNLTAAHDAISKSTSTDRDRLKALADLTQGQASAASDTFTGKLNSIKASVENAAASIGQKYGPAITAAGVGMTALGTTVDLASRGIKALQGGTELASTAEGLSTVAETAQGTASGVDAAAQGVLASGEAAADAAGLPLIATVGLIVAAVAAVGVGIYELYTHWTTVWGAIKSVGESIWHWMVDIFESSIVQDALTPIKLYIDILKDGFTIAFDVIKDVISAVWSVIKPIFDAMSTAANGVAKAIGAVSKVGSSIVGGAKSVLTLGGLLAGGGPTQANTAYIVGEKGPELFVPGSSGTVIPNSQLGGNSNQNIINVTAMTNADPIAIASEIGWALKTLTPAA